MIDPQFETVHMTRALELAARGEGRVEPNPMVGCTIVQDGETVGEGFHERFGGPHAEVNALASAGRRARGATAYVTLEPCCHTGKTGPCTEALIRSGIRRVVVAQRDPFPQVAGQGIARLEQAGIQVEVGMLADEARALNAPYLKLVGTGMPWVIAKWAMTLDGKLATRTGDSRWISGEVSRAIVHRLRGRVDGIMVGRGTVAADNPQLTARPPGDRVARRIVVDSQATLDLESHLVRTAREVPVIVAVAVTAPEARRMALQNHGCEVLICEGGTPGERLTWLLRELGRRQWTNLLVEGGGQLLGSLLDAGQIDEVHVFVAPKIVGGQQAPSPVGGDGIARMAEALALVDCQIRPSGEDVYLSGRTSR